MLARQPTPVLLFSLLVLLTLTPGGATAQRATSYDGSLENVVATWNFHAVDAFNNTLTGEIMGAGQPPAISILHLAMVHGAIYDAVMTIDGGYQPYLTTLPRTPQAASKAAAVATAAHDVLLGIVLPTPLNPAISDRIHRLRDETGSSKRRADPQRCGAGRVDWDGLADRALGTCRPRHYVPGDEGRHDAHACLRTTVVPLGEEGIPLQTRWIRARYACLVLYKPKWIGDESS